MSFPSVSRPPLTVWPMLPMSVAAVAGVRRQPMDAPQPETLTTTDGTDHAPTTPTSISIDDTHASLTSSAPSGDGMDQDLPDGIAPDDALAAGDELHDEPHDTDSGFDIHMTSDVESLDDESVGNSQVIELLHEENMNLQQTVASQQTLIEELRKQLQATNTQLATTEQRLAIVSQDLAASRSFVAKEDVDGQMLKRLFKDLNEAVDDQTFLLLDNVGDPPDDATVDLTLARALLDSHEIIRHELSHFVYASLISKMSLLDFSSFLLPAVFNTILLRTVFRPFIPGLDAARSAELHACYADICRNEPQDRAARWRSITYAQCCPSRNDEELIVRAVDIFYSVLESALPLIIPDKAAAVAMLRSEFSGTTSKAVRDALKLQDLFMSTYISFDYRLIAPAPNSSLLESQAKHVELLKRCPHSVPCLEHPVEGKICLALVSFGLSASKTVQVGHPPVAERALTVMEKAGVVAATCRWAQAHSS